MGWTWLKDYPYTWGFIVRVILKGLLLFGVANVLFALTQPAIGRLSIYNLLVNGRERLPYGENPTEAYNLSLYDLDAMFASHQLARAKNSDEYRVVLIGDSATWGFLLENKDTVAGHLNADDLHADDTRRIKVYNLGYPTMSLTKDLLLLDRAMDYHPDLIIWLLTLESFPRREQLDSPLVENNPVAVKRLITGYNLDLDPTELASEGDFWGHTLVGQRRPLADWLHLQLYGVAWATTGIDQAIPATYIPRQEDFEEDLAWHGLETPPTIPEDYLSFDVLAAGVQRVGNVPLLLVNEPMFISGGKNSNLRYNFFYPRWVYDEYRTLMEQFTQTQGVIYLDLWDSIPATEFTDSPVHMTPRGTRQLANIISAAIIRITYETE